MFAKYRIPQILGILTLFLQYSCSLENPIPTLKVMIKKSLHASLLNPFEVYSFYEYEA